MGLGLAIPGQGLQSLQIALAISLFDRVTKLVIQCRYQHYGGIGSIFLKDRFQLFGKRARLSCFRRAISSNLPLLQAATYR